MQLEHNMYPLVVIFRRVALQHKATVINFAISEVGG